MIDFDCELAAVNRIIVYPDDRVHFYGIKPEHFGDLILAMFWRALNEHNHPLDALEALSDGPFEPYGGKRKVFARLAADTTAMMYKPEDIREALLRNYEKREIITAAESGDVDGLMSLAKRIGQSRGSKLLLASEVKDSMVKDLTENKEPYSTGLKRLDSAMEGGMYEGKSYGFCARKKVGKTMLAATISHNLNEAGVKHLFICGEMSPGEIMQRMFCRVLHQPSRVFRQQPQAMAERLSDLPVNDNLIFSNAPGLTFDELKHILDGAVHGHNIKGFILDYWQLVGGKPKGKSTAEHQDEVAQWIADFSRKHKLFNVTFAQINQDGNTRGGEGIRLAFDQVYDIRAPEDDPSISFRYLEMMETRYTEWMNVGTDTSPGYEIIKDGLYFEER